MVLQIKQKPLTGTLPAKDNDTGKIEIPKDNLVRRIELLFHIVVTSGVTIGVGVIEDDLLNLVKKIRLVLDSDDNKFNVDLQKWFYVEKIEKGTTPPRDAFTIPAASSSATFEILVNADFANNRQLLSDLSALLPARRFTSLDLEVDWGDITDVIVTPNTTVIDTALSFVRVNIHEVFDTDDKANAELLNRDFEDLREGVDEFLVTKAHSSFDDNILQQQINPVPHVIKTHAIIAKEDITSVTGTPTRANDIITQLKIEGVKGNGRKIKQSRFDILQKSTKSEYGIENLVTGLLYLDYVDERFGGLVNSVSDDLKWRFLTNAPVASEIDAIQVFTRSVAIKR